MIDGLGNPGIAAGNVAGKAAPRAVAGTAPNGDGAGTAAPAPIAAATARALVRTMAASPPVDQARVAALRTAIAAGSYRPDPQAIATAIVAFGRGSA